VENMTDAVKNEIEKCRTKKQVMDILRKNHTNVIRDTSDEVGCFSVWVDETTRIYKPKGRNMTVQKWNKVNMSYSGIPVFFG